MNTLHQLNPTAVAYLCNIPPQFWVAAFIPGRRYGEDTSNIVERINFDFKALRELPIVELLQKLWHKVMTVRYQRYQQATTHNAQYRVLSIQACRSDKKKYACNQYILKSRDNRKIWKKPSQQ